MIVLDIHSPGGYTSVTMELMDLMRDAEGVETVAFIEKDATQRGGTAVAGV